MGKNDEWEVVRTRRGNTARQAYKELIASQKLNIPIVALPFAALAPEDPNKEQKKQKRKEKKKRAKARAREGEASEGDSDEDEEETQGVGASTPKPPAKAGTTSSQAATKAANAAAVAQRATEVSALFKWLYALITWIKVLLGLQNVRKPKPKPKPAVQTAVSKPAEPAKPTAAAAAAPAAAAAAAKPAAAAAASAAAKASAAAVDATAAAKAPVPPTAKSSAAAAPAASAAAAKAAAEAKPAATPQAPAFKSAAAPAAPPAAAAPPKPAANAKQHGGEDTAPRPAPKPAPPPPSGPASKCDKEWARGRFVVCELPGAHSDVVASVAVAGKLALSGGYDGALKVWTLRPGAAPARVKTLTGHSGRVEAVCANAEASRAASSGRDSSLKVWDLGATSGSGAGSTAKEVGSTYVYESVRCMAVDWGTQPVVTALGAKSGNTSLYTLDGGRKLGVLKGHSDEVTALTWGSATGAHPSLLFSGSADGEVRVWDVRTPAAAAVVTTLHGIRGRVCSLAASPSCLYVGDYSSTLKVFDIRNLGAAAGNGRVPPPRRLPNAPRFAGDVCPVAALHHDPARGVLLSSSIAWWTNKWEVLEEAPEATHTPAALLNVFAVDGAEHEYMRTVRLGEGIATCMAAEGDLSVVGNATGSLFSVTLIRGPANSKNVAPDAGGREFEGLELGCVEFSDDDDEDSEDEDADEA